MFASHAAIAMSGAWQSEQPHNAITARDPIGQAQGIPDGTPQTHL
jgi:hypothetical protein